MADEAKIQRNPLKHDKPKEVKPKNTSETPIYDQLVQELGDPLGK